MMDKTTQQRTELVNNDTNFAELFENSLKEFEDNKIVKGTIVHIDTDFILVDIGYKSEGQIKSHEFKDAQGNITVKEGDAVDVFIVRIEDNDGHVILSREKAALAKIWDVVEDAYKEKKTIKGKIISRVKGGLAADIGIRAFLPGSQIDLRPIKDLDSLVGTEQSFKVVKYGKRQGNIVLSRRAVLEEDRKSKRYATVSLLDEGAILEGVVRNITDYGLFVDLGGIDGLVHITDMSWGRIKHPSSMTNIGDTIKVKVLKFDDEKQKVSLGIKQMTPDPWENAMERYSIGSHVSGQVVALKEYGAFIEIEEGLEGLVHVSELSWTRKVRNASQLLSIGSNVDAVILAIDPSKKRISLSIKQLESNPWDIVESRYPVGTILEGTIKNITDFGMFIGITDGIDGLVHISDISWSKNIKHPSSIYSKGDSVRAVVLEIDKENERFSLGIKQLTPDPWEAVHTKYPKGSNISGTITNIADFGVFVELEEGVEGLIHITDITKAKGESGISGMKVGDSIQARVAHISLENKRIGLSLVNLEDTEADAYKNYINNPQGATSNLGALLQEEISKK